MWLVYLVAYRSELHCVGGGGWVVALEARVGAVAGALGGVCGCMLGLVSWGWIREALAGLPYD